MFVCWVGKQRDVVTARVLLIFFFSFFPFIWQHRSVVQWRLQRVLCSLELLACFLPGMCCRWVPAGSGTACPQAQSSLRNSRGGYKLEKDKKTLFSMMTCIMKIYMSHGMSMFLTYMYLGWSVVTADTGSVKGVLCTLPPPPKRVFWGGTQHKGALKKTWHDLDEARVQCCGYDDGVTIKSGFACGVSISESSRSPA